jgi:O-antigen ligase
LLKQGTLSSNLAAASPLGAVALTALSATLCALLPATVNTGPEVLLLPLAALLAFVVLLRPEIGLMLIFLSAPLETTYLDLGVRIKPQHILGLLTVAGWALQFLSRRERHIQGSILNVPLFLIVFTALTTFMLHSRFASLGISLFVLQLWFIAAIYLLANFSDRPETLKRCFWMLVIAGLLEAGYALIQSAGFYRSAGPVASYSAILQEGRPSGTFTEPDFLAPFLTSAFLLTLPFWGAHGLTRWRRLIPVAALLILTASMFAMVRASWLGMLAGLLAFAWLKLIERGESRRLVSLLKHGAGVLAAVALVTTVVAFLSPTAFSAMTIRAKNMVSVVEPENPHPTRAREISQTWSVIKQSPITGAGIGTFGITTEYGRRIAASPNRASASVVGSGTPLSLLHDQGILGLLAFALLIGVLFWRLLTALNRGPPAHTPYIQGVFLAVLGLTVSSAFNNLYYFGFYWLIIALAAALVMASTKGASGRAATEEGKG